MNLKKIKRKPKNKKTFMNDPIVKDYRTKGEKLKKEHYKYYSKNTKTKD